MERTEALAERAAHPHATGLAVWARGMSAYLVGHWKKSVELCERAVEVLRDQCTGVTWELTIANRFMLSAMLNMGEIGEVSRRAPVLLAAALEPGNLFGAMDIRTRLNMIWLAADDPTRARAEVIDALKDWPHEGFHLQHYTSMHALGQIELYTEDAEVAGEFLLSIGCNEMQGFFFSKPAAPAEIEELMQSDQPLGGALQPWAKSA